MIFQVVEKNPDTKLRLGRIADSERIVWFRAHSAHDVLSYLRSKGITDAPVISAEPKNPTVDVDLTTNDNDRRVKKGAPDDHRY